MDAFRFRRYLISTISITFFLTVICAAQTSKPNAPHQPSRVPTKRFVRAHSPIQTHVKVAQQDHKNTFRNPAEATPIAISANATNPAAPIDLVLTKDIFEFPGAARESTADQVIPQQFELLCYNQQPIGPTIRVRPGARLQIRLRNSLNGKPDTSHPISSLTSEKPHGFCSTNIHTHGLHISPEDPGDNVFRVVEPGTEWTYTYDIPADHPSGTHWYHPHKHGSVAYQLSNGLAGALIVEGPKKQEKNGPNDHIRNLEDIYEIAQMKENVLVIQLYNYSIGSNKLAVINAGTIYNVPPASLGCEDVIVGDAVNSNKPTLQATAINGQIVPTIVMAPGEIQRWRIIHASWDEIKPITFADSEDQKTADLRFREIACDGYATGSMSFLEENVLELAPGQRSDVLIQAPLLPDGATKAIYYMKQDSVPALKSFKGIKTDPSFLAKVVITGTPKNMALPDPRLLARCRPFRNIEEYELSPPTKAFKEGLVLNGVDVNQTYNINWRTFLRYGSNDAKQNHSMQPVEIEFNTAQEWTVTSSAPAFDHNTDGEAVIYPNNHTFHMHVNPFQIVRYTDPNGKTKPMNLWRDTLLVRGGETFTIRTRFRDYTGTAVLHCHILDHEDQGMMVPISISDSNRIATPVKQAMNDVKLALPALSLVDVQGKKTLPEDFQNQELVVVFFRGLECTHCTDQLRDLLALARNSPDFDAQIIGISSEPVLKPDDATTILQTDPTDRFRLLVDPDRKAFRDFGCFKDDDPKHGLFVVSRDGTIQSSYIGERPYEDIQDVRRRVRKLSVGTAAR